MSIAGKTVTLANRLIAPLSMMIQPIVRDLDSRPISPAHVRHMLDGVASDFERYLAADMPFPCRTPSGLREEIGRFYETYVEMPSRGTNGGSRLINLLWLFVVSRSFDAELIVDSGTYTGFSAWALREGNEKARLESFDIDLSSLRQRTEASYHENDWTETDLGPIDPERSLCYFDDHVDQVRRVIEARERGFKYLIFDDDLTVGRMPLVTSWPGSLPKLQFVYDDSLRDGDEVRWLHRGRTLSWTVDRAHLDRGRNCIETICKVPEIWFSVPVRRQNPYTLVVLK